MLQYIHYSYKIIFIKKYLGIHIPKKPILYGKIDTSKMLCRIRWAACANLAQWPILIFRRVYFSIEDRLLVQQINLMKRGLCEFPSCVFWNAKNGSSSKVFFWAVNFKSCCCSSGHAFRLKSLRNMQIGGSLSMCQK